MVKDLPPDDMELVKRAQKKDVSAFEELVRRYQQKAFSIAFGMVRCREEAMDIVQEAFLRLYRSIGFFRRSSSFYSWFYRLVVNISIDAIRRQRRMEDPLVKDEGSSLERLIESSQNHPCCPGGDREFEQKELREAIIKAIDALSPKHRAVIVLRELEGLSYEQIAKALGCSKGAVMSRLHYARKSLQKSLKTYM